MSKKVKQKAPAQRPIKLPRYRGSEWIEPVLPEKTIPWLEAGPQAVGKDRSNHLALDKSLRRHLNTDAWRWPKRPIHFISDMHADTDAFIASLVASGGIKKTGPAPQDYRLTKTGRKVRLMIGGDCFDKGPSTLQLLESVRLLKKRGADLRILAGNHDVRMMMGLRSVGLDRDPHTEHFFVRLGVKAVPLLSEIRNRYLSGRNALKNIPGNRECRSRLYPSKRWLAEFPILAGWMMPDKSIERETQRLKAKMDRFEDDYDKAGLSLREVYAAALKWQQLFIHPKGEFAWFFRDMQLARQHGSFLFIHAGVDDRVARLVHHSGLKLLNREFLRQMHSDLFQFYYGPIANTVRTKYRDVDRPLGRRGVKMLHDKGIHAIVHGHRNLLHGQRLMLRKGMLNFECDTTLDRNSRRKEGLGGHGAAVTIIHPKGYVLGISSDFPKVKVFDPHQFGNRK